MKSSAKQIAVCMSFCAGVIGIIGIFLWFDMGYLVPAVILISAIVLLFNIIYHCLVKLAASKVHLNKWVKLFLSTLVIVITVFFSVCGFILLIQDGIIFHHVYDPDSRKLLQNIPGFSEIEFTADNGRVYHGMMYQAKEGIAPLIIYFGGNAECSYSHMRSREELNQWRFFAGFNYLYVDYDGYGINGGGTSYLNMYEHSLAVYDYAVSLENVDSGRIVAMGFSLGTGSAVYLAANRPVTGIILAAPYASGYDLYNNVLPVFKGPFELLVKQKLPSDIYAQNVFCPAFIIASRRDETVPFSSSQRLSDNLQGSVDFLEINNVYHNYIFREPGVFDRVQFFLERIAEQ